MQPQYDITVIVCTYNRDELLCDALQSLTELETGGQFTYEVLVVDNASTDNTQQVVRQLASQHDLPIRLVRESKPGLSAARNCGIGEARGEWLAFFDDDELADTRWLFELRKLAQAKECRVVGGAVRLVPTEDHQQELSSYMTKLLAPGGRQLAACRFTPAYALNGGNAMIHHSVFEQVGLYKEDWTEGGEDTDWFWRLYSAGIEAWYTPTAAVRHLVPAYRRSPSYLRWVAMRQGWSTARQDVDRRGKSVTVLLALLRFAKGMLIEIPWLCWATLRAEADHRLFRLCQLWRAQGYLRNAIRGLAPHVFPQHAFNRWIEFRGERQQFAQQPTH